MGIRECIFFLVLLLRRCALDQSVKEETMQLIHRSNFPDGFLFGTSASAYQYEGAASEGGKGPSNWDTFTSRYPEKIEDRSNGSVATDSYHRYKEDVSLLKETGMDAYRFSISWTRILPNGSLSGGINREGVAYYNNLINEIISKGLKPFVTIFHFDSPQALEDLYGGFLSPNIVADFRDYAEVCFKEFGDRVKHWITMNEPMLFSISGYARGMAAPGRCSDLDKCYAGDSGREPYIVGHHLLLAHAAAVKIYKKKYQASQKGIIGIALVTIWYVPFSKSKSDTEAVDRALDFMYGWFMDPLTYGAYPFNMRTLVGSRLPNFTKKQSMMIKGSFDFIGLNYYTSTYAFGLPLSNINRNLSYMTDSFVGLTGMRDGNPIGPKASKGGFYVYPQGIKDLLLYTKKKYDDPVIYITENGIGEINNATISLEEALKDDTRIDYYHHHLLNVQQAIREGVDVRGYFAWSLLDNYEWVSGFTTRFGIFFVDFKDGLKRYPKSSALWFRKFLKECVS